MSGPELETERLLLRPPRLEDAGPALALLADPVAMAFIGGVHPEALADPARVVERWLERWEENGCGPFSVLRRADGRWLGRAGILVWDVRTWTQASFATAGEHAQPELGWAFAREHWGHGYATEAARAARAWAHQELGLRRLVSVIAPANARSAAVAARLGARPCETVTLFDAGPAVVWEHPAPPAGRDPLATKTQAFRHGGCHRAGSVTDSAPAPEPPR
ncbi:MAG TPA: GNAT family N-acetyltransferase [Gaiellaceae bacterium]|nr:GNAT family N-acetyltransferase [Gaiellaceae bacterium]